jgi:hypothetical protein
MWPQLATALMALFGRFRLCVRRHLWAGSGNVSARALLCPVGTACRGGVNIGRSHLKLCDELLLVLVEGTDHGGHSTAMSRCC